MTGYFAFEIPLHTVSVANHPGKMREKMTRTRMHRLAVGAWVKTFRPIIETHPPFAITLTRIAPRLLDDDNLRSALKAVRDGVADGVGIPNDRDPAYTWDYGQAKRGGPLAVKVEIRFGQPDGAAKGGGQ